MSVYYVPPYQKYYKSLNAEGFQIGEKTTEQLKREISSNPDFCRDEKSIKKTDLISYLSSGFVFYIIKDNVLKGVIVFNVNEGTIKIEGLCVPPPSSGFGTILIDAVKLFAKNNSIRMIKLTCYDDKIADFYSFKNGFRVVNKTKISYGSDSDSDDSDEDEEEKIRYEMLYVETEGGSKRKTNKSRKSNKPNKSRKNGKTTKNGKSTKNRKSRKNSKSRKSTKINKNIRKT